MKTPARRFLLASAAAALAGLVGCSANSQYDDIRADLTPELETLHERQSDMDNSWTIMMDENGRMFVEDLGRAWYTNRPSRLTPEPVPR